MQAGIQTGRWRSLTVGTSITDFNEHIGHGGTVSGGVLRHCWLFHPAS